MPKASAALVPPPGPDATRPERIAHARRVVERLSRRAHARVDDTDAIEDGFGRQVGRTEYPKEKESKLPLRLNAIVRPQGEPPFATIEHQNTGFVGSYAEGTMLRPGVLPGIWIVDIEPGVVHLLDLESNRYEFLTFEEPPKRPRSRAAQRRARARKRAADRKKRRRSRRSKR